MKKILLVFGTRPEAIKMAPLVLAFKEKKDKYNTLVCVTGQHRQMLDQVLNLFDIKPDFDLNIMKAGQDLYDITSAILTGMRDVLDIALPDVVFVHGDTTTSTSVALAAFYKQIPVAHVEAGLRTGNIYSPWPEEMNRQITGRIATYHFSPTEKSKQNLIDEGVEHNRISVTGNTVIDTLLHTINMIQTNDDILSEIHKYIEKEGYPIDIVDKDKKIVLITGHRRENFGKGFANICNALKELGQKFPNVDFIYPMHLNPNVRNAIKDCFDGISHPNIYFTNPFEYLPFTYLMSISNIILTDSGGIQEEAPSLGKPVLVMRDTTERPEAIEAGTVKLIGTDRDHIINEVSLLLTNEEHYIAMASCTNPYGTGDSSHKIINDLEIMLNNQR
ncbi:UDP-N-acetylglucosamine 2-epimerase (non-hydrolyzing) [Bacteroidales bacterium OttesenSCG-928-A17]|nr:UDP-N-acetylglucosamine 2-epimerase (non-hydrolyzing) [Bacteroidales bacterium OttesenSCG-928-A17]